MPVGMAMRILAAEKIPNVTCGSPTLNMWCTHSKKLMKPVATIAATIKG